MNIFEDLVIELKEENLLERTFIDLPEGSSVEDSADDAVLSSDEILMNSDSAQEVDLDHAGTQWVSPEPDAPLQHNTASPIAEPGTVESADLMLQGNGEKVEIRKAQTESEFFKKRAAAEMSSLKMVDAVLSAVEREHLKVVPRSYDDLAAKSALHAFMQVADEAKGEQQMSAEFRLLSETERWCSALAERDRSITVAHLRVYCETCKPMLSSQAMLALGRFYRNLPYSDMVRGKFDFIMTRLFSRPHVEDTRILLFTREQMQGHIKTLYADWSSIPMYPTDEDDAGLLLTALSFEELAEEAEAAAAFDDLIKSDFFGRLRLFKESIAETYLAPSITASAVECNIRIGNRYVELINLERSKMDVDQIHQRFAELDDQTVSEAAGRSLGLMDILRQKTPDASEQEPAPEKPVPVTEPASLNPAAQQPAPLPTHNTPVSSKESSSAAARWLKIDFSSVNKYFLAGALILVAASIGIFVWANYVLEAELPNTGVKTLSFQGTLLGDHVKTAKLSGETLYLVAQPTYLALEKEKQVEVLQHFLKAGDEKGWTKVNIMNASGQTIGFASPTRVDIYKP